MQSVFASQVSHPHSFVQLAWGSMGQMSGRTASLHQRMNPAQVEALKRSQMNEFEMIRTKVAMLKDEQKQKAKQCNDVVRCEVVKGLTGVLNL